MSRYLSELALRSARSESAGSDGSSIGRRHQSGMVNENSEVRVEALRRSHAAATPRSFRHIADLRSLPIFHHHLPAREPTHHPLPAPSAQAQGARHAPRIRSEGATAGDHTRAGSGTRQRDRPGRGCSPMTVGRRRRTTPRGGVGRRHALGPLRTTAPRRRRVLAVARSCWARRRTLMRIELGITSAGMRAGGWRAVAEPATGARRRRAPPRRRPPGSTSTPTTNPG